VLLFDKRIICGVCCFPNRVGQLRSEPLRSFSILVPGDTGGEDIEFPMTEFLLRLEGPTDNWDSSGLECSNDGDLPNLLSLLIFFSIYERLLGLGASPPADWVKSLRRLSSMQVNNWAMLCTCLPSAVKQVVNRFPIISEHCSSSSLKEWS
jgi:hypothetical protein